jgi:hypothetical protein
VIDEDSLVKAAEMRKAIIIGGLMAVALAVGIFATMEVRRRRYLFELFPPFQRLPSTKISQP